MKSLVCTIPGTLDYREGEKPARQNGQTILKICRVGVCGTDLHAFDGTQPFFQYPRVLGHELAAIIEETDAEGFANGDMVTIIPYFNCGKCIACRNGKPNCCTSIKVCGVHIDGAMAEYLVVPSSSLVSGKGFELDELALVEPLAIGAHAISRAAIQKDEWVLVIGAGPIGMGVTEFARIAGGRVIVMDINENRLNFCRDQLKIEYSINTSLPGAEDRLREITGNDMPTLVIDATGNLKAIQSAFQFMAHGARYILVGLQKENICFSHPEFHKREATLMSSRNALRSDFEYVMSCIKNKQIDPAAYITHTVLFDEVKHNFESWLQPGANIVKAIIHL